MARKKRKTRKKAVGAVKKTRVFGGKRYSHKMCSTTKTAAKKSAKSHRDKSKRAKARVVKVGGKYCVYTRG